MNDTQALSVTHRARRLLLRACRVLSLLLVSSLGTVMLMRCAPGYFDDEREMSAEHAGAVRAQLEVEHQQTTIQAWAGLGRGMLHGDFGISRQYGTPVWPLVAPRLRTTARLLVPTVLAGSLAALCLSVLGALYRRPFAAQGAAGVATIVCAVPVSVVALFCLLSNWGGAAAVLFTLVVARDFRFFSRLVRRHAMASHLFFARASGIATPRLVARHLLWPMRRELLALVLTSFLIGLNAVLPIEVLFGVPGVGQLAWGAAMNRDLPVLLTVTILLSLAIAAASLFQTQQAHRGAA